MPWWVGYYGAFWAVLGFAVGVLTCALSMGRPVRKPIRKA